EGRLNLWRRYVETVSDRNRGLAVYDRRAALRLSRGSVAGLGVADEESGGGRLAVRAAGRWAGSNPPWSDDAAGENLRSPSGKPRRAPVKGPRAAAVHLTVLDYLRRVALQRPLPAPVPAVNGPVREELRRIGVNLNQLVYRLHRGDVRTL